jgi:nicotinamide mononucleotide transporter
MLADLQDKILAEFFSFSSYELIAVSLGLIYLLLAGFGNRYAWISGGFSSLIYIFVFAETGLWFNALLNGIYVLAALWGWMSWSGNNPLNINIKNIYLISICLFLTLLFGIAGHLLGTKLPFADGAVSALSIAATYLLINRLRFAWACWSVVNFSAALLFFYADLWFTSFLYLSYSLYSFFFRIL